MFTNQLPSEPSNQLQSSPRPSLPAQSLPKSQFSDLSQSSDQLPLKSPTSNQSTRPVHTPKPIKLLKPLLPQLLPWEPLLLLPQLPLVLTPLPQLPMVLSPLPQLALPLPQLLEPSVTVDTLLEPDNSPVDTLLEPDNSPVDTLLEPDTSPVPLLPQLLLSQSLLLNTKYFTPQNIRKFKSGQFVNFKTKLGAKTLTSNLYKMKLKASKQCQRTN